MTAPLAPVPDLAKDELRLTQDGAFPDANGDLVRAYDDVVLLEPTLPENDPKAAYVVPAGTIGTVLFHCGDGEGLVQLELYWRPGAFVIGYSTPANLRLHLTGEQKLARLGKGPAPTLH